MSEPKKCENASCACITEGEENYCSPFCEASTGVTEVLCECGHDACRVETPASIN
jgi:hypothetical protein